MKEKLGKTFHKKKKILNKQNKLFFSMKAFNNVVKLIKLNNFNYFIKI